jgi:hypothetical protein
MAEERLSILDSVFADEPEPEVVAIRDQAYRNALVLSATVIAPGFNDPGERYFVVDRHAREVSASAGAETTEERLASARDQLAAQRQRIAELQREKETLLKRRPLVRFMADRLRHRRTGAGS